MRSFGERQDTGFEDPLKVAGALRAAGHILRKIVQDPRTRRSLGKMRENNATIFDTGRGVAAEITGNPEVRETAKDLGRSALIAAGVVDYDPEEGRMTPNWRGIGLAVLLPEVAIGNAVNAVKEELPDLAREAARAAPDAVRNYHVENPGAFKEAGLAALSNVGEAVKLPFHVGRAAVSGMFEAAMQGAPVAAAAAAMA